MFQEVIKVNVRKIGSEIFYVYVLDPSILYNRPHEATFPCNTYDWAILDFNWPY